MWYYRTKNQANPLIRLWVMAFQKLDEKNHDDFNSQFDFCVGAFARFINNRSAVFSMLKQTGTMAYRFCCLTLNFEVAGSSLITRSFLNSDISGKVEEEGWRETTWQEVSGSEGTQTSESSKGMIIKSVFVWKNFNEILSPALEIYNAETFWEDPASFRVTMLLVTPKNARLPDPTTMST